MRRFTLIIMTLMFIGCFNPSLKKTGKEGKPLPEFSLLLTDSSSSLKSRDIPSGKPIVLFYLSPFCPFCKAQTKAITEGMDELKNFQFYFVSDFPLSDVKRFYTNYKLADYPNITIGLDTSNAIRDYFEISGVPFTAVYDKNKKLVRSFLGKTYTSQIRKAVED